MAGCCEVASVRWLGRPGSPVANAAILVTQAKKEAWGPFYGNILQLWQLSGFLFLCDYLIKTEADEQ